MVSQFIASNNDELNFLTESDNVLVYLKRVVLKNNDKELIHLTKGNDDNLVYLKRVVLESLSWARFW